MGIFKKESYEEKCERLQREYDEKQAKWQKEFEEQQEKERLEKERLQKEQEEQEKNKKRLEEIRNQLKEETKEKREDILYQVNLKDAMISLYKNRIVLKHKQKIINTITKGRSGFLTIYLKNLEGIEYDNMFCLLQFITPSFGYIDATFSDKIHADNCVDFDANERMAIEELIDMINGLM